MATNRRRIEPGPDQESVWDYPRPPAVDPRERDVCVEALGVVVAESSRPVRILETSHPPVYYLPLDDVRTDLLERSDRRSTFCEFKGRAHYYDLVVDGRRIEAIAWSYPDPSPDYEAIEDHFAFYPSRVEAATVDGEEVRAQEGDFYGGWITDEVVGPFKGGPGTLGW
jgi:uncharacterized protein (DUF427 family)